MGGNACPWARVQEYASMKSYSLVNENSKYKQTLNNKSLKKYNQLYFGEKSNT